MVSRLGRWIVATAVILIAAFVFVKVEGGFIPWFLFYFLVVLVAYEWLVWLFVTRNLDATRHLSATRCTSGQTVEITLEISHQGWFPLAWLRVRDEVPARFIFHSTELERVLIPLWKRRSTFTYRADSLQRGVYHIGDIILETGDFFGIIRRKKVIHRHDEILVFPKVISVRGWTGYHPEEMGLQQPTRRRSEESTNVLGVREYVPGDRLSRIHWPASARRMTLQAKEFELHVTSELMFLPDLSMESFHDNASAKFELAMTITASLIKHAFETRRQYSAAFHGKQLTTLPFGSDQALFVRSMESLAIASPNGQTDFASTLARMAQEVSAGATMVVVSPRLDQQIAVAAEFARRKTQLEWFVPLGHGQLTDAERQGLAMLNSARVNVYAIGSAEQLTMLKRGGVGRATEL